jgi:hypothetical protein
MKVLNKIKTFSETFLKKYSSSIWAKEKKEQQAKNIKYK